jgi:PAS domain S-box-containing protein
MNPANESSARSDAPRPLTVLLVEDRASDAELIVAALRRSGLQVTWSRVDTETAYIGSLDSAPDLVLADYRLPQFDALRALGHLTERGLDIPFIVVSGTIGDEEAAALIKAGAADYLLKDRLGRLGTAVRAALTTRALLRQRQRDEEALRESAELTRLVLSNALDAVITIDDRGRILSWNPQAERVFGWSGEDVHGRLLSETIVPAQYREAHERGLEHFRATGEGPALGRRLELSALRRDGSEFPIELTITALRAQGATRFSAFVRDTTERSRAEGARRESEASFRLLFASNPLPMWVFDVATLYFLEVNGAAVAQYGYAREEFLRMRVSDIRPPEDLLRFERIVAELAAGAQDTVVRHAGTGRHRFKDGRIREVDVVSHSIVFGGRRAALVVVYDVTELRAAERSLAKSNERLQILHEIDRGLISADPPAAIAGAALRRLRPLLGALRASVAIFDLPAGRGEWLAVEVRGRAGLGRGARVRFPLATLGDIAALRKGEVQLVEDIAAEPTRPLAKEILAEGIRAFLVVPLIAGGELIGSLNFGNGEPGPFGAEEVGIARDVGTQLAIALAQARLLEQVQRQAEELERRVDERTLALSGSNARLEEEIGERRRAEAVADRANQAKSAFLSRMSHELRTPLNAILGFAQLLDMDLLEEDARESLGQILRAGRHLLGLINEVLDISRIETGQLPMSLEPVFVSDLLQVAIDLVRPLAETRGITVPRQLASASLYVLADRQRLQQVLLNLLSNAVKYNSPGGRVELSCEEVSGARARIAVTDTGPGIAPDKIARLFTPFDRLGAEATTEEGTGLGLTLSKHLAEAMAGTLTVDSQLGKGTTFACELPIAMPPPESSDLPTESEPALAVESADQAPMLVLYIEDNLSNLRLVERIAARRPYVRIVPAMQGRLGLELAREHRPDLILLDRHLPDMEGDEVLRLLLGNPVTAGIPVVILSADASPNRVQALLGQGARAYLTKPFDVSEFLTLLDEFRPGPGR